MTFEEQYRKLMLLGKKCQKLAAVDGYGKINKEWKLADRQRNQLYKKLYTENLG